MIRASQKTVVMVDDDSEDVFAIRKALNQSRINVEFDAVDSGVTFLQQLDQLESTGPDLVLLDINMPRMSGYDVLGALKSASRWRDLPVIMLTTSSSEADRRKSLDLGAADFVTKPHSLADMTAFMKKLEQCIPGVR